MSLGTELIAELGRRGERGMYFDFAQYRRLRRVDSVEGLGKLLEDAGHAASIANSNVAEVADALRKSWAEKDSDWNLLAWLACDPFLGLLMLPVASLWLAARHFTRS